jgi:hypothetical protein
MSAPIVKPKRQFKTGPGPSLPVAKAEAPGVEKPKRQFKTGPGPSLPIAKAEAPVVAPPMVAKKAEGGGGSMPVKAEEPVKAEPEKLIVPDIKELLAGRERPLTEPWYYIKGTNSYPVNHIRQGMRYIIDAMRMACSEVKKNPKSLSKFGNISVPITLLNGLPQGYEHVYKGAWNQGQYIQGPYDSPDIHFDNNDKTIGGRIGIRWIAEDSPADEPGKAWWGAIILTCEYSPFTQGKANKWEAHARCDYQKADDYEDSQNIVDKALNFVVKENKNSSATFDISTGTTAYDIAQKTIDAYIAKTEKPEYELGVGPFDAEGKKMAEQYIKLRK